MTVTLVPQTHGSIKWAITLEDLGSEDLEQQLAQVSTK